MEMEVEEAATPPSPPPVLRPAIPSCFKCVVCGEEGNEDPEGARLLPCLHHICSNGCLAKQKPPMVNGATTDTPDKTIICPECSITFEESQTGRNKYTKDYPGLSNGNGTEEDANSTCKPAIIKCTFCDQGNTASSYCTDCKEFLCTQCTDYHMKMKMTKSHVHSSVEEGMIAKEKESSASHTPDSKCSIHDAPYAVYCTECDEELCQKCSKSNHHAGHDLRNLSQCVQEFRDMLSNAIPELIAYRAKTGEALIDLEAKVTNVLQTERVKLLTDARTHFHKAQAMLLQRELDVRTNIVKKTVYKAKELNVKRFCVQSMRKQTFQYLELIPKLLEYKDHQLFSKRQWLTKQYFRLRESVGILLDEARYKDYVEADWFFYMGDGVLLETIMALKALGGFVYTDGVLIQDKMKTFNPVVPVTSKAGTIESILEEKYRDKHPKELTDHLSAATRTGTTNGGSSEDPQCDLELEALEASVENEYIGFDNLKKQSTRNVQIKEKKSRFLSGTTLESLLDEKVQGREDDPMEKESDRLSKYISDKTEDVDMEDSNSEYDPVLLSAKGVSRSRRNTHSETDEEREEVKVISAKRGRPKGVVKHVSVSPTTLPPPQAVRKSSRFEVSPRPGLALATTKARRSTMPTATVVKEDAKTTPSTTKGRGRPPKTATPSTSTASTTPASASVKTTKKRILKGESPPRLTREDFLIGSELEAATTDSEGGSHLDEGEESTLKRRKSTKRKQQSSDEEFTISESDHEERRKSKTPGTGTPMSKKIKKDPFTKPKRRKSMKKKDAGTSTAPSKLAVDVLLQNEKMKISQDDENEDYCTVCLDGGEDLICCDKCPKVFHIKCHLPALHRVPPDDFQCLCCVEKDELDKYTQDTDSTAVQSIIFPPEGGMKKEDFIYACKFLADIYGQKSSLVIRNYFEKLQQKPSAGVTPLFLNTIRNRLTLMEGNNYKTLQQVHDAVQEMRRQAGLLLQGESTQYGGNFKEFSDQLEEIIQKYFPKEETPSVSTGSGNVVEETPEPAAHTQPPPPLDVSVVDLDHSEPDTE